MSTATLDNQPATPPTDNVPDDWVEKDLKLYGDTLTGRAGVALARHAANSEIAYAMQEFSVHGDKQKLADRLKEIGSDMKLDIGNTITTTINNYSESQQPTQDQQGPGISPQTPAPEPLRPTQEVKRKILDVPNWFKLAVAAAIPSAALVGGTATYLLMPSEQPAPIVQPAERDDFIGVVRPGIEEQK